MSFDLPTIPPQPSAAPASPDLFPRWQTEWLNYRWALQMHSDAACRNGQADMRVALVNAADDAIEGVMSALRSRRVVTKAEVVMACIPVVPPAIRQTENSWAGDVMKLAEDLWTKMQADPAINPPVVD